jgi:ferritin-like protein
VASTSLHEDPQKIGSEVIDRHRAITSLMEELEAIDWYDQRVQASDDPTLTEVLAHNRDEEKEHAAMVLEWLRRHDPVLDKFLKLYLFTEVPIRERKEDESSEPKRAPSLGIGSLREASRR